MEYDGIFDQTISSLVENMLKAAQELDTTITSNFNDIPVIVNPGDKYEAVIEKYSNAFGLRHNEYFSSEKYKKEQEKIIHAKEELAKALQNAPPMTLINPNNVFGIGQIESFAKDWARLMEKDVQEGKTIIDCADKNVWFVSEAYEMSCTTFAVALQKLFKIWHYGEQLKEWYQKVYLNDKGGLRNDR